MLGARWLSRLITEHCSIYTVPLPFSTPRSSVYLVPIPMAVFSLLVLPLWSRGNDLRPRGHILNVNQTLDRCQTNFIKLISSQLFVSPYIRSSTRVRQLSLRSEVTPLVVSTKACRKNHPKKVPNEKP
jgi:hypothetical protein